jgi:hypothetical protein
MAALVAMVALVGLEGRKRVLGALEMARMGQVVLTVLQGQGVVQVPLAMPELFM